MNWIGLAAALATFCGVWFGHVIVRKVEFSSKTIWLPALMFIAAGLGLEFLSVYSTNQIASIALGILGVTVLWDALEMARQEQRVKKGHAPANPQNPRHALILKELPAATALDLLRRNPVGHPVSADEAIRLVKRVR